MPHFFINSNDIKDNKIIIKDSDNYNHIARSLRTRVGEMLLFIDESEIQYYTKVKSVDSNMITTEIINSEKSKRKLPFQLYLAQSPLRSDAQNFVIEKATELGVRGVIPILTDNCALKKDVIIKKIPKWQKIMIEASKQCERADIPTCFKLTNLKELIKEFDRVIVFCERIATKTLKDIKPINNGEKILVVIGPEGGFSQKEFEFIKENNLEMITLGDLILKAETAVTVGLGNIIYEFTR